MFVICQAPIYPNLSKNHSQKSPVWSLHGTPPGHASLYWVDAHTGIVQFTAPLRGERLGAEKWWFFRAEAWGVQGTNGMKHRCGEDVGKSWKIGS